MPGVLAVVGPSRLLRSLAAREPIAAILPLRTIRALAALLAVGAVEPLRTSAVFGAAVIGLRLQADVRRILAVGLDRRGPLALLRITEAGRLFVAFVVVGAIVAAELLPELLLSGRDDAQ